MGKRYKDNDGVDGHVDNELGELVDPEELVEDKEKGDCDE